MFCLRFPGQYWDDETGLHYNWNRYYDPSTGRYITADPIGLEGGMNLYAYANLNPVNYIDAEGLNPARAIIYRSFMLAMAAAKAAKNQIVKGAKHCKNIRCKIANHPAHHRFGWPYNKRMPHIQLTCWVKGKKGSQKILRFPYSARPPGGSGGGPNVDPDLMP